jgi:DNA-binding NtrC family response regulator
VRSLPVPSEKIFLPPERIPLEMPPLRGRKDDIPTLVEYFIHRYSTKAGKKIGAIEKRTAAMPKPYGWPGNIRELQNVIERSVIGCETDLCSVDQRWLSFDPAPAREDSGPFAKASADETDNDSAELRSFAHTQHVLFTRSAP